MLISQPNTKPFAKYSSSDAHSGRAASLNADGTLNWFIPPYVIPALIVLLVAARPIWLA
jgi:hypothetical protein